MMITLPGLIGPNTHGGCHRSLYGPSMFQAKSEGLITQTSFFCPFYQRHRYPLKGQHDIITSIAILLLFSRPSTVIRRVVSIIVDTINAVLDRRTRAYVSQEVSEIVPPFTYSDSPTAVLSIISITLVHATVSDVTPYAIFRRLSRHSVCSSRNVSTETRTRSAFGGARRDDREGLPTHSTYYCGARRILTRHQAHSLVSGPGRVTSLRGHFATRIIPPTRRAA